MSAPDTTPDVEYIENLTYDEISIGDCAVLTRTLKQRDIDLFAVMSGDVNPAHVDAEYARTDMFHGIIAHGMWGGALISTVLGTQLPGPGTIFVNQSIDFMAPVTLGDTITVRVEVTEKQAKGRLLLACTCLNQNDKTVIEGVARVIAPREKIRRPRVILPDVLMHVPGAQYARLIAATDALVPVRTAVVHPCDPLSLTGALDAALQGMITPVLVGPQAKIAAAAAQAGRSLDGIQIIDAPHSHAAAAAAVALARAGEVDALMKGSLHTDELMEAVVDTALGLRTERRMSHIYVLDVPTYPKPLLITDAAINIYPDLAIKRDIVQNAINLALALGIDVPKVAILSAVETVNPRITSTLDAAALCKMADRGQITGGLLDGPLAFDNAISPDAVAAKGIVSNVAGIADILIAPDLEAANMIAKQLIYLAQADAAGIVLGASVPIILTSRADSATSRLASCALAQLFINYRTSPHP
ncbi:bifunctional enoyl-CoA hydratase/phosphate acetyltransferase [Sulfitobacter guttiformis]|uniref:Phosphate acetyltransferase/phosphate butyryltransferase n=1 Tax=Sulfitobacter guttiformis TaxID=74349 RepID=A0A420DJA7_9RHOB|nr:bifunctional enoyl-CoA hydratase/phosphate acetyltransferase [Sulfitobacter guttiformis]KIN71907.1 Phosphate acetyltransferase [Sulfitobacter guttiformis KCTC 32187]RKE94284.1 phosphate acetyltransferase/phosphate butyryltransferase [Sulfitobacter guttiformis]